MGFAALNPSYSAGRPEGRSTGHRGCAGYAGEGLTTRFTCLPIGKHLSDHGKQVPAIGVDAYLNPSFVDAS